MNILITRVGRLGDMLMIVPAIREIESLYPHARLHFITSTDGQRVLKSLGFERCYLYPRGLIKRYLQRIRLKHLFRRLDFAHSYCFETAKKFHSWMPKDTHCLQACSREKHYATRCLELVNSNKRHRIEKAYFSNKKFPTTAEFYKQMSSHKIFDDTILIGLHPSYSKISRWKQDKSLKHRAWPIDYFAKLACQLKQFGAEKGLDVRIMVDLLPAEKHLGRTLQRLAGDAVLVTTPQPNFKRYVNYIDRLNVLVAPNTGAMHLAAALNTPCVALFSHFSPKECGPYMPSKRSISLRAEDTIQPQMGLAGISVDRVFSAVTELLPGDHHIINQN